MNSLVIISYFALEKIYNVNHKRKNSPSSLIIILNIIIIHYLLYGFYCFLIVIINFFWKKLQLFIIEAQAYPGNFHGFPISMETFNYFGRNSSVPLLEMPPRGRCSWINCLTFIIDYLIELSIEVPTVPTKKKDFDGKFLYCLLPKTHHWLKYLIVRFLFSVLLSLFSGVKPVPHVYRWSQVNMSLRRA